MKNILKRIVEFLSKERKNDSPVKTPLNQHYANSEVRNKLKKLNRNQKK